MTIYNRDRRSRKDRGIPSVADVRNVIQHLTDILYSAWRCELSSRIRNLELIGYIAPNHIDVPNAVWRLPNEGFNNALRKIQEELDNLGYEFEFKFEQLDDDVHWILCYSIDLPKREEDDEDDEEEEESDVENGAAPSSSPQAGVDELLCNPTHDALVQKLDEMEKKVADGEEKEEEREEEEWRQR